MARPEDMSQNPTLDRLAMSLTGNGARAAIRIIFQLTTDRELLDLHESAGGLAGDPVADLVRAEIENRDLER